MITISKSRIISLLYNRVISNPTGIRLYILRKYRSIRHLFGDFKEKSLDSFWEYPSERVRFFLPIVALNEYLVANSNGYHEFMFSNSEDLNNSSEKFGQTELYYTYQYIMKLDDTMMHRDITLREHLLKTFAENKESFTNTLLQYRWFCATNGKNII